MARVERCRRSTLPAAVTALASVLALAGCGSSTPPSLERTARATSATSGTTTPTPPPGLPQDVGPVFAGLAHRAPPVRPELADLPHALGREVHVNGKAVFLPRGAEHIQLTPVTHGLLASAWVEPGDQCRTYLLAPEGRLLQLRGACEATAVNAAGTLVTGRYLGLGESPTRYAVYAIPSGRLTAISPALPGEGARDASFAGNDVVLENPEHATLQSRWNVVTGTLTDEPRPRHTTSPQQLKLIDEEWSSVPSPDGGLSALVSSGGQLVGVWRTSTEAFVVGRRALPGFVTGAVWLDGDHVLLTVATSAKDRARLATLRVSTGRVTWSASLPGQLLVVAARPGPVS